eukprot:2134283-Amphidinium_carterae.1
MPPTLVHQEKCGKLKTGSPGQLRLPWKETSTGKKPDHVAIQMEFDLELVSQGYQGQKSYETAERTHALDVAVEYQRLRDAHLATWSTALYIEPRC